MSGEPKKPRILLWDLETAPLVVTAWQLYKPHLSYDNIVHESYLISAAWKWLNDTPVYSASVTPSRPQNDKPVVTALHAALLQADVLVAHNGDRFDLRRFNTAAVAHGLSPIPKIPTIDTLKVARKHFAFPSNRLDYLGKLLCGSRKTETRYNLWLRCMNGDDGAIREMVEYNRNDVILLEQVYLKLRPFIDNHPNVAAIPRVGTECPKCGSTHTKKMGIAIARASIAQRHMCHDCCGYFYTNIKNRDAYVPPSPSPKESCSWCSSTNTNRDGFNPSGSRIYACRSCGRRFTPHAKSIPEHVGAMCPACSSTKTRHSKVYGNSQYHKCRVCHKHFKTKLDNHAAV